MEQGAVAIKLEIRNVELAAQVAALRALDFDDPRAEIRQPKARRRPREELAEIDRITA